MEGWTAHDEEKFAAIKQSEIERGHSPEEAASLAGRIVNKARRLEGRTPNKRTQGTGNPNRALEELTRDELYNRAKEASIAGRARMSKADLVRALQA